MGLPEPANEEERQLAELYGSTALLLLTFGSASTVKGGQAIGKLAEGLNTLGDGIGKVPPAMTTGAQRLSAEINARLPDKAIKALESIVKGLEGAFVPVMPNATSKEEMLGYIIKHIYERSSYED